MAILGLPELIGLPMLLLFYGLPVVAVVWVLLTLRAIRANQERLISQLASIERALLESREGPSTPQQR